LSSKYIAYLQLYSQRVYREVHPEWH